MKFFYSKVFIKQLFLATIIFSLIVLASIVFLFFYTNQTSRVVVPDLVGVSINEIDKFTEIPEDHFNRILEVNLIAPFLISQKVVKKMKDSNWGRIINVTSIFSKVSKESRASYSASKFGLDGLTAAMSAELSNSNILVNSVSPGFIETDLTNRILGKTGIEEVQKTIPIGRLGSVKEIASFISWLASDENTYISGQNLVIDGGFTRV